MADDNATPSPDTFKNAAQRSQEAGIADETAAYETAIEGGPTDDDKGAQDEPAPGEVAAQLGDLA